MKPIKMLGLAVVAALATMAMLGAASASATQTVELCKVPNETPCEPPNLYEFSPEVPLPIASKLKSEQAVLSNTEKSLVITCQKSEVSGKATETQPKVEEKKQQIIGEIESASWTECRGPLNETCTATALQVPWTVHLNQKANQEQNNGDMYVGETFEINEKGEKKPRGQPGALIKCKTILGTVECEYKSKEEQPEEPGEWVKLQVLGGNPATIIANEVQLKKVRGGSLCGTGGLWNAEYEVTEPKPLYVTHQEK